MTDRKSFLQQIKEVEKEFGTELSHLTDSADELFDKLEKVKGELEEAEERVLGLENAPVAEFENNSFNNIVTQSAIETILRNIEYIPTAELEEFANKHNRI